MKQKKSKWPTTLQETSNEAAVGQLQAQQVEKQQIQEGYNDLSIWLQCEGRYVCTYCRHVVAMGGTGLRTLVRM